jgi:hypothetical protein
LSSFPHEMHFTLMLFSPFPWNERTGLDAAGLELKRLLVLLC